jgi:hypothetical protein
MNDANGFDVPAFQRLLKKIREDQVPEYGSVHYDGQSGEIRDEMLLGRPEENPQIAKERLLRYLEGLTPDEQSVVDIEVETKEKSYRRLIVTAGTSELSPERLAELKRRINP